MNGCYAEGKSIVVFIAAAICLTTLSATPALAQRPGGGGGGGSSERPGQVDRRIVEMNRQRDEYDREMRRLGEIGGKNRKPSDYKQVQAMIAQVKQDFERLQVVYNQIVLKMSANGALDYRFISEATAEVKRCASRLKTHLVLPQPEDDEKSQKKQGEFDDEQMKTSLLMLRQYIVSFVTNPLFESPSGFDIELSTKASRDLKKIIEVSDSIRKGADKLDKSHD